MQETWKDIPTLQGLCQVSDLGRVRVLPRKLRFTTRLGSECWRTTKERIAAHNITRTGYALVHLQVDGQRQVKTVHELVMLAFVGPRPEGLQINHKDGDKRNNHLPNLEYVTCAENHRHAVRMGLLPQARPVLQDGRTRHPSIRSAAQSVGVTAMAISYAIRRGTVCRGSTWGFA